MNQDNILLISIVIPTYNNIELLNNCLSSLLNQSFPTDKYEIIVVDDGSTDSTADMVKSIRAENRIKYFYQPNQGPALARNQGAEIARGDIIVFTDSDCVARKDFIEQIYKSFADNPEIAGVMGAYRTRQRNMVSRFAQAEFENRYRKLARPRYIDFVATYAAAFRRNIFLELKGFDPGFPVASNEDVEFSYRLAERGYKMVFNPGAIVYHRHPETVYDYLKSKFGRAFWRMQVYKLHPEKIQKDSYTPQPLKFQILLSILLLITLSYYLLTAHGLPLLFILIGLFLLSTLPFLFSLINPPWEGKLQPLLAIITRGKKGFRCLIHPSPPTNPTNLPSIQDYLWCILRQLIRKGIAITRMILSSPLLISLWKNFRVLGKKILGFLLWSVRLLASGIIFVKSVIIKIFRDKRQFIPPKTLQKLGRYYNRCTAGKTILAFFSLAMIFLRSLSMGCGILFGLSPGKDKRGRFRHFVLLTSANGIATFFAILITYCFRNIALPHSAGVIRYTFSDYLILYPFLFAFIFAFSWFNGLYNPSSGFSCANRFVLRNKIILVTVIILSIFLRSFRVQYIWITVGFFWIITVILSCFFNALTNKIIKSSKTFHVQESRILIVGTGEVGKFIWQKLSSHPFSNYIVVGFCSQNQAQANSFNSIFPDNPPLLGTVEKLSELIKRFAISDVYFAVTTESQEYIMEIINNNSVAGVRFHIISSLFDLVDAEVRPFRYSNLPISEINNVEPGIVQAIMKRILDLVFSIFLTIATFPLWLGIMIAIKIETDGPATFKQERVGLNGQIFQIIKFRTMYDHVNKYEYSPSNPDDQRITRVGQFLRRTSLDELPQLINIIKGEMSLVGPRPEMVFLVEKYRDWEKLRLTVKPGLTGLWQILGRKDLPLHENLEYDFYYIKNHSLTMDLTILLKTIPVIFARNGAF